jgi:hypothetical protein
MAKKIYLGDSVYAESDGYGIWLTTENGYPDDPRNKIYLEPSVLATFDDYRAYLRKQDTEGK